MDINYDGLKERISLKMKEKNISSRAELAKEIGIGSSTLENNLKGSTSMSAETLIKIAKFLDVSIDWLIYGDDISTTVPEDNVEYLIHCINVLLNAFEENLEFKEVDIEENPEYTGFNTVPIPYTTFVIKDWRISNYLDNYKNSKPTKENLILINQPHLYDEILKKFINAKDLKIFEGHLYDPRKEMAIVKVDGNIAIIPAEKKDNIMVPYDKSWKKNSITKKWYYDDDDDLPF